MVNKSRVVLTILVLLIALTANAACESVVRNLPDTPVGPGDEITIELTQAGFFLNVVEVTEYLPDGFVYVTGSYTGSSYAPVYNPSDNTLVMMLAGADEITVTYNTTTGTVTQIGAMFFGLYDGFVGFEHVEGGVTGDATLISDTTPPTIDSVTLAPTVVAVGDPILVTVDATDDVRIASVAADGVELTESGDVWTGTIIAEGGGTHFVCVSAYDTSGNLGWNNSTSYTTTTADTTDPIVHSVTLNRTDVTTGDPILVTVDATDNVGVDGVTAEGVELAPQGGDIWTGVLIAVEGTHTVHVCARDAAGNAAWDNSTSYTATDPDTESPVVHSVELNETDVTTGDPILVTVNATDDTGVVSVTAEGVALTPLPGNIWEGVIIAVTGTDVVVNVCAMDGAGNVGWNNSTSYTTTTADTTDPIVNSVTLNRTDVTAGDPILVTVNATDDTGVVSVTAEGVALTPLPGNIWEGIIIAVTGTDVVVNVCAMDGADNTGWNNSTSYTARWIREDVYPDGEITITDIVLVGNRFGETGEPGWIPEDVYPDGEITITDIVLVGNHFGETKP